MEKFKDVEINGRKFRLGLPSARDGSWIVSVVIGQKYHDPSNYARAQDIVLSQCQVLREGAAGENIPQLIYRNGRFLIPELELETDTDTVTLLSEEALEFCVGPTLRRLLGRMQTQAEATGQA